MHDLIVTWTIWPTLFETVIW